MIDHTDLGDLPAGTPEVLHYLHDVLGSVVALTDSNGAVVERYDYDPYGATYILDPAGVPRQLLPVDPWAADGYFHDHDQDGDLDADDYADLVACANDTPYDPMCIYSHDRNGDRRVDHVDVGAYLAHADSNGLVGPPAGLGNFGRPLRLAFDADGDGRIDLFDWYALQTCFDRGTTRCTYLFDADASAAVDGPDLDAFRASAEPPYSGPPSKPWRRQLVASRYGIPWMWTGQRYDATTGQYHFWARTYSPRLGRWMQRDPLGYIDGVNAYEYARSLPSVLLDQFGLYIERVVILNRDGTVTWHLYDRGITGLFKMDYLGSITFDPNDDHAAWQAQYLFERGYDLLGAARDFGNSLTVVLIVASMGLPGPEDAILAVLGIIVKAGQLYRAGKLLEGDELLAAQREIRALRELWARLRKLPGYVVDKLKEAGIDIHKLKQDLLGSNSELKLFDLFYDPDTGRIYSRRRGGVGEPIDTGLIVGDFCSM